MAARAGRNGRRLGVLSLIATFGSVAGCDRTTSADDCRAAAEHYLDLAVQENVGTSAMSPAQLAAIRQVEDAIKHAEPGYRDILERCGEMDRAAVSCALRATTANAWETCLRAAQRR